MIIAEFEITGNSSNQKCVVFGLFRRSFVLIAAILLSLSGVTLSAAPRVSSLFVPLAGDVTLSNGDVVTFSGQVHILTRFSSTDAGVPAVQMYVNLIGVEGTSATTGDTYILVGASNTEWAGADPGPPNIPEQTFNFNLVETNPGPPTVPPSPIVPVFLRDFVFAQEAGSEGVLLSVTASFLSD